MIVPSFLKDLEGYHRCLDIIAETNNIDNYFK